MNNKINDNFELEFINMTGILASQLSLNPTVGQIYGLLYISPEPVSLNEMVEKLGISKGSASTNIRILESWGAVRKVWVKGSRRDFYEAELDTLNIVLKRAKLAIKKRLDDTRLQECRNKIMKMDTENIPKEEKKLLSVYKERFSRIEKMKNTVMLLLESIPEQVL